MYNSKKRFGQKKTVIQLLEQLCPDIDLKTYKLAYASMTTKTKADRKEVDKNKTLKAADAIGFATPTAEKDRSPER